MNKNKNKSWLSTLKLVRMNTPFTHEDFYSNKTCPYGKVKVKTKSSVSRDEGGYETLASLGSFRQESFSSLCYGGDTIDLNNAEDVYQGSFSDSEGRFPRY